MSRRGGSPLRHFTRFLIVALAAFLLAAPPAGAADGFGLKDFTVSFEQEGGAAAATAGSHPHSFTTAFGVNTTEEPSLGEVPIDAVKDLLIDLPPGLVADAGAVDACPAAVFIASSLEKNPRCPDETVVGYTAVRISTTVAGNIEPTEVTSPVYNMDVPRGAVLKFGFFAVGVPITFEAGLASSPPYNGVVAVTNVSQAANFYGAETEIWGDPADSSHDALRGACLDREGGSNGLCPVSGNERPFLTLPRSCSGPLRTSFRVRSWQDPGSWVSGMTESEAMEDCASLAFGPTMEARLSSDRVSSPSGLAFDLDIADEGLISLSGRAASDIRDSIVTLPPGVTINPSQAEGLGVCSEAELAREGPDSEFGAGCPAASKIGTVEVETPLLEGEILHGSLFVAEPYANRFGSLIALFMVVKSPERGIVVRLAGEVEPSEGAGPQAGRLRTSFEGLPQLPLGHVRLRLREGGRSPLISPPACGSYETQGVFVPHARPETSFPTSSAFQITRGIDGGACPAGAPFAPGFSAGTLNNQAGSYSPFLMRITRGDGMQDLSRFSAVLPPGVVGRIAGIPWCPEAGIAQARARTGEHGGAAELADPSCPAAAAIGRTVAGAGVGSQLTYVPGSLYLAGPYGGAPLSVVSITPAVAGPFDAGAVVVRVGLDLDPRTGVVSADGSASDPIPHILQGIPLNVRDLRVYADRPDFTLNATSCEPSNALATLWGAGTALAPRAETPVGRAAPYQAAGCAALGFAPKLAIKLRGGTKRGAHPALRAVVTPRPGDANFSRAVVTLPRSAFLDQAHIRTICTRVQFAAGAGHGANCPPGAVYGQARAWSPLLDEPLSGPVFLRSSENNLPDLVVALKGPPSAAIEIELSARIDSIKGGIRSTFTGIPDAPVSRFILDMQGGKKGLIVNSRNLCHRPGRNRAKANVRGQNGKVSRTKPRVIATKCAKRRKAKRKQAR